MPSREAVSLRRQALNVRKHVTEFASRLVVVQTSGAPDMTESDDFAIRMVAVFETRLHARMRNAAKKVVGEASRGVVSAFINDTRFVLSHNKQKIMLRMMRNPHHITERLQFASCTALDTDEAEYGPQTETTRYADIDSDALTATVAVPGFGIVCISVPRNDSGKISLSENATAVRIP